MKLIDLPVNRILPSSRGRKLGIVVFRHDDGSFSGLIAQRADFQPGQVVTVLLSENGTQISWPPSPVAKAASY